MWKQEDMPDGWEVIRLQDVVERRRDSITLDDEQLYRRCTVQLHNRGIIPRDEVYGHEIRTKRQYPTKMDDLLVAEIDAKVGGFGIVHEDTAGSIVSSHYYLYEVNQKKLNLDYFEQIILAGYLERQVAAVGSTNYAAIRADDVLGYKIPYPPLDEQRRIAEVLRDADVNIVAVEAQITEAQEAKRGALQALITNRIKSTKKVRVEKVLKRVRRSIDVQPDELYREIGIRSHGKGIFHKDPVTGEEIGNKRIYWIEPCDFVFNIVFAWEGAVAIASEAERGMCGSHRFPTYRIAEKQMYPAYLLYYFTSYHGVNQLLMISPGGAGRNKTINQSDFVKLKIPCPSMNEQCEIADILRAHDNTIRALQSERDELVEVKRGLMQKLLSGEVRV